MAKQITGSGAGATGGSLRRAMRFRRYKPENSSEIVIGSCEASQPHPTAVTARRSAFVAVSALALVCAFWTDARQDEAKPDPRIHASATLSRASPKVASIFNRACADCHSNEARWPWYSKVPPISWIVSNDVSRGRKAMNLSKWAETSPLLAATMLKAACADMQSGRMPLPAYRLLHPGSRLTRAEIDTVCQWTQVESRRILEAERLRRRIQDNVPKLDAQ